MLAYSKGFLVSESITFPVMFWEKEKLKINNKSILISKSILLNVIKNSKQKYYLELKNDNYSQGQAKTS